MTEQQASPRPAGSTAAGPAADRVQPPAPPAPPAPQSPQSPQHAPQNREPTPPQAPDPRADDPRAHDPQARDARAEARPDVRPDARPQPAQPEPPGELLAGPDLEAVTRRWRDIQAGFVDEPQQAVKDADALVADLMNRLMQMFTAERRQLESHWSRGDEISTEDLRVSLQRYRTFFQRLLSVH